ncbi:AAA family ATPase [Methylovulum sp.]
MTVVIGKNGVGKSTLFDVFGFLADALKLGVEDACDLSGRGGFEGIRSQGQSGAIEFEIAYRESVSHSLITYKISVDIDGNGRPFITAESFFQVSSKSTIYYLVLIKGFGFALKDQEINLNDTNENGFELDKLQTLLSEATHEFRNESSNLSISVINQIAQKNGLNSFEAVGLTDNRKLGIATLGALTQHPRISAFRQFIENWYLSYFTPDAARTLPMSGAQQHLNSKGDNIANFVQFMERERRDKFQNILNRIAEKIPGIGSIKTYRDQISNQLHLLFQDIGFDKPFYAPQMSDGTLKVFAYLLLLEDPNPPPFICIEEPENGLYHKLLETLAAEFRSHATGKDDGSQLFITTHQPYFVDALEPEEVWVLEKGEDGFAKITRASDIPYVQNMVNEGLPLGSLWYSDYLDAR